MSKKFSLVILEAVFLSIVATVVIWKGAPIPPLWMLPLFVLATMRTAHTVSYNEVMEWLREPFCEVKKDSCGAGDNVHPRTDRGGFIEAVGGLLSCPSACSSTWTALALYTVWAVYQPLGVVLVLVFGFAGGSEVVHYVTQFAEWGGRAFRVVSGKVSPDDDDVDSFEELSSETWSRWFPQNSDKVTGG